MATPMEPLVDKEHHHTSDEEIDCDDPHRAESMIHPVAEEQTQHDCRQESDQESYVEAEAAHVSLPRRHIRVIHLRCHPEVEETLPVEHHHGEDGSELDHDGEGLHERRTLDPHQGLGDH